jgi:hypothetical protein
VTTVALAGLVALAMGAPARDTGAHGGRVRLAKVPAGPYLVSVWTLPDPPRVGSLDVSLAVMEPRSERALLDAAARLTVTPRPGPGAAIVRDLKLGGEGNPILYHALLEVPSAGAWQVTVAVEGPAGRGEASFDLSVKPTRSFGWSLAPGVVVGLAVLAWVLAGRRRGRR